jgi:molecular chaperone GrpE
MKENEDYNLENNQEELSNYEAWDAQMLAVELEELRIVSNDCQEQLLRARAEFENLQKRMKREIENTRKFAIQDIIDKLLPAKDSMEKGLDISYIEDGIDVETLLAGMTSTLKICNEAFLAAGVEEIDPKGEVFNPEFHEAVIIKKVENEISNIVTSVFQKGYLLNGRLIRPARVEVSSE